MDGSNPVLTVSGLPGLDGALDLDAQLRLVDQIGDTSLEQIDLLIDRWKGTLTHRPGTLV